MNGMIKRVLSLVLCFDLLFQQIGLAQVSRELNLANYLTRIGGSIIQDKFRPVHMRYFSYDALNDNFKALLDKGDTQGLGDQELRSSTKNLLNYFLLGVTLPNSAFWVNLKPDSEKEIIDPWLEDTDIGKIMLEADLQLKKDTAAFTSPRTPEGKVYWDRLYKKAEELYGYQAADIPTLTRPWIVPGEVIVRETQDSGSASLTASAYVYKATLKVMLEDDYLTRQTGLTGQTSQTSQTTLSDYSFQDNRLKTLNKYSASLIRELIIPKLVKEINSSKRYAALRQVYYSLILSRWFKLRFTGKSGSYSSLINSKNLTNLISRQPWSKTDYFKQYQRSFAEGEYNIREPVYTPTGQVIRSYFSGGFDLTKGLDPRTNPKMGIIGANSPLRPQLPNTIALEGNANEIRLEGQTGASSPIPGEKDSGFTIDSSALVPGGPFTMLDSGFLTKDLYSIIGRLRGIQDRFRDEIRAASNHKGRWLLGKNLRGWVLPWVDLLDQESSLADPLDKKSGLVRRNEVIQQVIWVATRVREAGIEAWVNIGIGGSDLPAQALVRSLLSPYHNELSFRDRKGAPRIYFTGNDFSPNLLYHLLFNLDQQGILFKTKFNVVSKSGTTAETIAAYLIIRSYLQQRLAELAETLKNEETAAIKYRELGLTIDDVTPITIEYKDKAGKTRKKPYFKTGRFFIATTGLNEKSALYQLHHAKLNSWDVTDPFYAILPVPEGTGGRFSAFTPVGLLALGVAAPELQDRTIEESVRYQIYQALRGAKSALTQMLYTPPTSEENVVFMAARNNFLLEQKGKIAQLFYIYDPALEQIGQLMGQLSSESLQEKGQGQILLPLLGSNKNHSYWNGVINGRKNVFVTFVTTTKYQKERNLRVPQGSGIKGDVAAIEGFSLGEVQNASAAGTAQDAAEHGVPNYTIAIPRVDVFNVAKLIYTLQSIVAVEGKLRGLEVKNNPDGSYVDLTYLQSGVEGYKERTRQQLAQMRQEREKARASRGSGSASSPLGQEELGGLFEAQKKGDWRIIQENQPALRETLLEAYQRQWDVYKIEHPSVRPIFDMANPESQSHTITPAEADEYNLRGHFAEFVKKSDASTAGIRGFIDLLHSENPTKMYNDMFTALLIEAEAEFLKEVHQGLTSRLPRSPEGIASFAEKIRSEMDSEIVTTIEEVFDMPLERVITFLRDNVVKLVGGEVRVHTGKFVEMESRTLASKGIKVITLERFSDSVPIYIYSFLTYLLGVCGATHYTSSHSANYLYGRKSLAPDGAQLLPDIYENYRRILRRIIEEDIYDKGGYTLKLSHRDSPNIIPRLSYSRMAKLYRSILNITQDEINLINEATRKGHHIVLNGLNGSTWKMVKPLCEELGIDTSVFHLVMEEEDSLFSAGYVVTKAKDGSYVVDHLGIDTTLVKVVQTIPYSKMLKGLPAGTRVHECDPDSDRFVVKQIVAKNPENDRLLREYAITSYPLEDGKILIAPSPNKAFLVLDIVDHEIMRDKGTWEQFWSMYYITYVSTRAWAEFAEAVPGLIRVMATVGFKNLTALQREIEDWYFNRPNEFEFSFKDQLGRTITVNRERKLRIHSKEEESGGRVAGMNRPAINVLGQKVLAMPEKSAADSLLSELLFASRLYLENDAVMQGRYFFLDFIQEAFARYGLKSKVDVRIDLEHGNQGEIATKPYSQQQKALEQAAAIKTNFNNFFFSLGKAVRDGTITLEKAKEILTSILPRYKDTWDRLTEMTLTEEALAGGRTRPEGVPMIFSGGAMVTEIDLRPSGTDPLKSKVYLDAVQITDALIREIEQTFSELTNYDLYKVLEHYGIPSIAQKPDLAALEVNLKELDLNAGPALSSSPVSEGEESKTADIISRVDKLLPNGSNSNEIKKYLLENCKLPAMVRARDSLKEIYNEGLDEGGVSAAKMRDTRYQISLLDEVIAEKEAVSSSPIEPAVDRFLGTVGGIDFRGLPMNIQALGSFSGLNFKLPQLSQAALEAINIDSEIEQIKNLVQAGIVPSGERIKEFITACLEKGKMSSYSDALLFCLADILKLEEDTASESSPDLREALVIVESGDVSKGDRLLR